MGKTVFIAVPTAYDDIEEARAAVEPYVKDMRVIAGVIDTQELSCMVVGEAWDYVSGCGCCGNNPDIDQADAVLGVFEMLSELGQPRD